jgi:translation initiation factor 6
MNISRIKILGSSYIGLFGIANNTLCFVPRGTEEKTKKDIEKTLDVKVKEINIYDSALLAVFSRMNNKKIFLPSYVAAREVEEIEKEVKTCLINTEQALGNLIEINDTCGVVSQTLTKNAFEQIKKQGLELLQTNIARSDAIGSSLLLTNTSFLINPNSTPEEVKKIQQALNIKGGASTANTGDAFVRNSIIANDKGFVAGDLTTGHELNRIDEALNQQGGRK